MSFQDDRITGIPAPLPYDYDRQYSFKDWETGNPGKPKPAAGLEAEFNAVERAVDETQARLRLIQRDDGAILNDSVGLDQLKEEALTGVNAPEDWMQFTRYSASDSVIVDGGKWYIALESHVSSDDFTADFNSGYWRLLLDLTPYTVEAKNWAQYPEDDPVPEGDGTEYSSLHHSAKALAAEVAAKLARDKSQAWAETAEDTEVETGQYSALHHAAKSEDFATASSDSATDSANSATASATARDKSQAWAETAEDTEVETGQYSALHHAAKSEDFATASSNSADASADSAAAAAATYDNFDDRYLGSFSSHPATDNDGDPLMDGALYWNDGTGAQAVGMYGYSITDSQWRKTVVDASSFAATLLDDPDAPSALTTLGFTARHYDTGGLHEATGQITLQTPEEVRLRIGAVSYVAPAQVTVDVNAAASWDDSTYATPANRAGQDFYVYYCQPAAGYVPDIVLSANSTVPTAIPSGATPTADNTRKVSGFHCLCADVGTISDHPLSGYVVGDVLPRSVWDLYHRPESEPEGMVYADSGKWVDVYLVSVAGGELTSQYNGTTADGSSAEAFHWYKFDQWMRRIKKRLPFQGEFVDFSIGSNQGTHISGSADPVTTGGHTDTAGRRMISNIGCEDCAGALWQWGIEGGATNDVGSAYSNAYDSNDSGVAGQHYEAPNRPLFGGGWGDAELCGSRGSSWYSSPLGLGGSSSARGVAEPAKNRRI